MSDFNSNIRKLLSGNIIAQAISFAAIPLLTQLFSPQDIGIGSTILMTANVFVIIFTLKMDVAIFIDSNDRIKLLNRFKLSLFSIFILGFLGVLISPILVVFYDLSVILITLFLTIIISLYNIFMSDLNFHKEYKKLVNFRVINTLLAVILKLIAGYFLFGWLGFSLSIVLSYFFIVVYLIITRKKSLIYEACTFGDNLKIIVKQNIDFIKFNVSTTFINSLGQFLPIILFSSKYGMTSVGLYTFTITIMRAPINMIGEAYRKVFLQLIGELKSSSEIYEIKRRFISSTGVLFLLSLFLFLLGGVLLYYSKGWLLGGEWQELPSVYLLLLPWFVLLLTNIPAASLYTVFEKHKFIFYYEIIFMTFRIFSIILPIYFDYNFYSTLISFVLVNVIFNIIYIFYSYVFISKRSGNVKLYG